MSFILLELSHFLLFPEMLPSSCWKSHKSFSNLLQNQGDSLSLHSGNNLILPKLLFETTRQGITFEVCLKSTQNYTYQLHPPKPVQWLRRLLPCLSQDEESQAQNSLIQCRQLKCNACKAHSGLKSSISASPGLLVTSTTLCSESPKHSLTATSPSAQCSFPTASLDILGSASVRKIARKKRSVLSLVHLFIYWFSNHFSTSQTSGGLVSDHFC